MNQETRAQLNAINRAFYSITAAEFDQTRGQAWMGWENVRAAATYPAEVLDVGCGNGRFAVYMAETGALRYHGMDNNPQLLAYAGDALNALPNITALTLETRDIVETPPDTGTYSLVVLFGVIHHIPGAAARVAFMQALAERVAVGGILAFASWRFYEFDRFRDRIVPWETLDANLDIEAHDYLLDWRRGEHALRYCHYVDDREQAALIRATGLEERMTYRADGFTGTVNCYSLLRKK